MVYLKRLILRIQGLDANQKAEGNWRRYHSKFQKKKITLHFKEISSRFSTGNCKEIIALERNDKFICVNIVKCTFSSCFN